LSHKLEVGERRSERHSLASHYTLTTESCNHFVLFYFIVVTDDVADGMMMMTVVLACRPTSDTPNDCRNNHILLTLHFIVSGRKS